MPTYSGTDRSDLIIKLTGDNTITNIGVGLDIVTTGGGNDTVYVTSGGTGIIDLLPDIISLGTGDDRLVIDYHLFQNSFTMQRPLLDGLLGLGGSLNVDEGLGITFSGVDHLDVTSGSGADTLYGGTSSDHLAGGFGVDSLVGGAGEDSLEGGGDGDTLDGEDGNDLLSGDAGNDTLIGGIGNDVIYGRDDNDDLRGGDGNDKLDGGLGSDLIQGGAGTDIATYLTATGSVHVSLSIVGAQNTGAGGIDTLVGIEGLRGSDFADTLTGDSGGNQFVGMGRNDVIAGLGGADTIDGGDGTDTLDYSASHLGVTIDMQGGNGMGGDAQGDHFTDMEAVIGSSFVDVLNGSLSGDFFRGGDGSDQLSGRGGNDTLRGENGDDVIMGDAGDDVITGGLGADMLTGGTGADRFVFMTEKEGGDRILDFSHAEGDKIDLSVIDANSKMTGNQGFTFIGSAAFTGVAGQVHVTYDTGIAMVEVDVNGNKTVDLSFALSGIDAAHPIVASDFIL